MSSYLKMVDKAGDQAVSALKQAEDTVVNLVSQASDFVGGIIPEVPSFPLSEQIPTLKQITDTTYSLIEKLLDANKDYMLALAKALEPITTKVIPNGKAKSRKASASTKAA